MHRAEVKFNTLTNPDGTGTQHQHFFLSTSLQRLVLTAKDRVIVWRGRFKLSGTGVHHLVSCYNSIIIAHLFNFFFGFAGKPRDHIIRKLYALRLFQQFNGQFLCLQSLLHLHKNGNFINKPDVNLGNIVNLFVRIVPAQRLRDHPDTAVVHFF